MEKNTSSKRAYQTVMVDPPWDIHQKGHRGAIMHYNLMTLDQIKAMPVGDLVEQDSHCWLWLTAAAIPYGKDVLNSWGFEYRSIYIWTKPRMGQGAYLRNAAEFIFLGTRGNAPIRYKGQPNWGFHGLQDHSHKPEEQYAIIERCSPGPYLELFARRRQPGWDCWGNEIDGDIVIPGYPVPSDAKFRKET